MSESVLTEVDLASEAIAFFHAEGFEMFNEVSIGDGRKADIVGTRGNELLECETKLGFGLEVMEQAEKWRPYANAVWIAIPWAKETSARRLGYRICERHLKVGVLEIGGDRPVVRAQAPLLSRMDDSLLHALREEHKTFARAGSPAGGEFTAAKTTFRNVAAYVKANPLCTMEEVVASIGHHYRVHSTAVAQLTKHAKRGEIPDVYVGWKQRLTSEPPPDGRRRAE